MNQDPNDQNMQYVTASEVPVGGVTRKWVIFTVSGEFLGEVKWYSQWRRYAFFPDDQKLFDCNCLWDIADFLARKTSQRKEERKSKN